ncbi:MAG: ribonuclease HI [Dehalococcoidia bacterium]
MTEVQRDGHPGRVIIYTDGACIGNPGPGGWGAVIVDGARDCELSGGYRRTTNNRMEMRAAIEALEVVEQPRGIDIYTDSSYLRDGITRWIKNWLRNGWRTAGGSPVKNADLWKRLLIAQERHVPAGGVAWHWVRGHAGHPLNDRADRLANAAARHVTASDPVDSQTAV